MDKISVIVPVYNSEEYLDACLSSIVNQTWRNLEVILIDDGSVDRSGVLCDIWASRDARIRVIHQENLGVSAARNAGLDIMTGDWVSFIDSDDTLDTDMYAFLLSLVNAYQVKIVHCGYRHIVGEEVRLVHDTKKIYEQTKEEALGCLIRGEMFGGGLWDKLFSVEYAGKVRFRTDLKIEEDIFYNFEVFQMADRSVFADYAKYNYIARRGSSACFTVSDEKKVSDGCDVARSMYMQLKDSPLAPDVKERYLRVLSGMFRLYSGIGMERTRRKEAADEMWRVYKERADVRTGKRMRFSAIMIHRFPALYLLFYRIYEKMRTPSWEPGGMK